MDDALLDLMDQVKKSSVYVEKNMESHARRYHHMLSRGSALVSSIINGPREGTGGTGGAGGLVTIARERATSEQPQLTFLVTLTDANSGKVVYKTTLSRLCRTAAEAYDGSPAPRQTFARHAKQVKALLASRLQRRARDHHVENVEYALEHAIHALEAKTPQPDTCQSIGEDVQRAVHASFGGALTEHGCCSGERVFFGSVYANSDEPNHAPFWDSPQLANLRKFARESCSRKVPCLAIRMPAVRAGGDVLHAEHVVCVSASVAHVGVFRELTSVQEAASEEPTDSRLWVRNLNGRLGSNGVSRVTVGMLVQRLAHEIKKHYHKHNEDGKLGLHCELKGIAINRYPGEVHAAMFLSISDHLAPERGTAFRAATCVHGPPVALDDKTDPLPTCILTMTATKSHARGDHDGPGGYVETSARVPLVSVTPMLGAGIANRAKRHAAVIAATAAQVAAAEAEGTASVVKRACTRLQGSDVMPIEGVFEKTRW